MKYHRLVIYVQVQYYVRKLEYDVRIRKVQETASFRQGVGWFD